MFNVPLPSVARALSLQRAITWSPASIKAASSFLSSSGCRGAQVCIQPAACCLKPSSARSDSIFGNGQVLVMRTVEDPADPLGQLVSCEQSVGLYNLALAVNPSGLYGVQPRALLGQKAADDPNPKPAPFDLSVMFSEPAPDLL